MIPASNTFGSGSSSMSSAPSDSKPSMPWHVLPLAFLPRFSKICSSRVTCPSVSCRCDSRASLRSSCDAALMIFGRALRIWRSALYRSRSSSTYRSESECAAIGASGSESRRSEASVNAMLGPRHKKRGGSPRWPGSRGSTCSGAPLFGIGVHRPIVRCFLTAPVGPIHDHVGSLERDQTAADHLIELRKDRFDPFARFDALDDDREVRRQELDAVGVQSAAGSESHRCAKHGCAGIVALAEGADDRFVQRLAVKLVALADIDAHECALAREAVHAALRSQGTYSLGAFAQCEQVTRGGQARDRTDQ